MSASITASNTYLQEARRQAEAGMRWFGPEKIDSETGEIIKKADPVTMEQIARTPGVKHVVTALHHIKPGEVWTKEEIVQRKIEVEFKDNPNAPTDLSGVSLYEWHKENSQRKTNSKNEPIEWITVESLIFSEAVKNARDPAERARHIENYKESLKNLGEFGIKNVMGNFMLVMDWTRTGWEELPDGSVSFKYDHAEFTMFDIYMAKRHVNFEDYIDDGSYTKQEIDVATQIWETKFKNDEPKKEALQKMIIAGLPGANQGFTIVDFKKAVEQYKGMTPDDLRENINFFLKEVVPVAQEAGINLCSHPDDPAFTPFAGTPRAVGDLEGYKNLLKQGCGVGLCPGSLMVNMDNRDIPAMIRELVTYGQEHGNHGKGMTIEEIFPHVHLRPIEMIGHKSFREGHHVDNLDTLLPIIHALVDVGYAGVYRPDHAPSSIHNDGNPGYDGTGRGFGAQVLQAAFNAAAQIKSMRPAFAKVATATVIEEMRPHLKEGVQLTEDFTLTVEAKVQEKIREAEIEYMHQILAESGYYKGEYKTDGKPETAPPPPKSAAKVATPAVGM